MNDFHAQFYGFFKLPDSDVWFELLLIEGCLEEQYTLTFTTILMTPKNEGRVILNSKDPSAQAKIDFHPTALDDDILYLVNALKYLYLNVVSALRHYDLRLDPSTEILNNDAY